MTVQISPKSRHLEPCEDLSRDARGAGGRRDALPVQVRETLSWSCFKSRPGRLLQIISCRNGALLLFGRALGFALGLALLTQFFLGWVSGGAFACTACPSCVVLGRSVPAGTLLLSFLCGKCGKAWNCICEIRVGVETVTAQWDLTEEADVNSMP